MNAASERLNDWIDGFLFVSNRPILDLLNNRPVLEGVPTELLTDARPGKSSSNTQYAGGFCW